MNFSFINYSVITLLAVFSLIACDAPDSVRFGNNQHSLSKDLYASVHVDFMHYQIALGDTIEEVQNKLGFYLNVNDFETHQQAEFKVNPIGNSTNSKVECFFVKQRLVSFTATQELIKPEKEITDTLKILSKLQPAIGDLSKELSQKGISMYSIKDISKQITYTLNKNKDYYYRECKYQIAYPEFACYLNI
jgi:hypothetical protein